MPVESQRVFELALSKLLTEKSQIDEEIAAIRQQMREAPKPARRAARKRVGKPRTAKPARKKRAAKK